MAHPDRQQRLFASAPGPPEGPAEDRGPEPSAAERAAAERAAEERWAAEAAAAEREAEEAEATESAGWESGERQTATQPAGGDDFDDFSEPSTPLSGAPEAGPHGSPEDVARLARVIEALNPAQRSAVLHERGPLAILAGAGSGKTRVITTRIAHLVLERGVPPARILAITFTNKAAREMRGRVESWVPDLRGSWITTFHASCARLLRREIGVLPGYTRDFSIYDTGDRNRLLKELVKRAGFDPQRFRPAWIGAEISRVKNSARHVGLDATGELQCEAEGIEDEVVARIARDYAAALRERNALDFDDLLLKVLEVFGREPGVRDAYAERFLHVMVDEYQDTNRVQYLLLRHFASVHGNVAVCGDPDQSIYGWRGADVRNILDFERDFPGAVEVRLEQNYRSSANILRAAQAMIAHNVERKQKDLWSESEDGALITVTECGTEDDEALEIAARIRALVAAGRGYDECAIFYRVNFMQRALEQALARYGIPHEVVSGTAFYERREIKDLVAWLRLVVNERDDEAFKRAITAPACGVGQKSLATLVEWAADRRTSLLAAAGSSELANRIRGRAKGALAGIAELLARLAPLRDAPALVALDQILAETGYLDWLARQGGDDIDREENVQEFRARAETFDRDREGATLRDFLADVALVSDADAYVEGQGRVSLMTMHTAKGLEFPIVFVCGLEENLLPHARSIDADFEADGDGRGVEEERRLFYVALTRAREKLFLSHAQTRRHFGQESWARPSRFLEEVPATLVEGYEAEGDEETVLGEFVHAPDQPVIHVGNRVRHDHFGYGRVERLVGQGVNARATVAFESAGRRDLLLHYAKLEVVG